MKGGEECKRVRNVKGGKGSQPAPEGALNSLGRNLRQPQKGPWTAAEEASDSHRRGYGQPQKGLVPPSMATSHLVKLSLPDISLFWHNRIRINTLNIFTVSILVG